MKLAGGIFKATCFRFQVPRLVTGYTRLTRGSLAGCCYARIGLTLERRPLTHEFLAQTLGTGRAAVSLAAEILQRSKLIVYSVARLISWIARAWNARLANATRPSAARMLGWKFCEREQSGGLPTPAS